MGTTWQKLTARLLGQGIRNDRHYIDMYAAFDWVIRHSRTSQKAITGKHCTRWVIMFYILVQYAGEIQVSSIVLSK
jgi:hypothetical protein